MQVGVGERRAVVEQLFVVFRLAKRSDRIAFDGRVGADECCALGFGIECAESFESPEGMDGAGILAKRPFAQCRDGVLVVALHQEALGSLSPEQVVAVKSGDELLGFGLGQGLDFRFRCIVPNHAVDAAVLPVAVGVDVRVAPTALGGIAAAS